MTICLNETGLVSFYVPDRKQNRAQQVQSAIRTGLVVHVGYQNGVYLADEFSSFLLTEPQRNLAVSDLVRRGVGVILVDFVGKFQLERWIATRRSVWRSINWLRKRAKREPLIRPE